MPRSCALCVSVSGVRKRLAQTLVRNNHRTKCAASGYMTVLSHQHEIPAPEPCGGKRVLNFKLAVCKKCTVKKQGLTSRDGRAPQWR